ncbi:hypothetical protein KDK95_30420 [Actinospica sp. MGRD01-02]|uniref:Uncharacterized protein n=1 Tax=Actinospica acidithermotolerans TaxID=2828514 RepID=A0A941EFT1_9ACTN|nr:hypothetical protein [Actinospica acidithermotolerans]MBR7830656.1 hypothetical protein [Actinospica acidithermotolerans]
MGELDEAWADELLDRIRALTVGDLEAADDPRALIEALPEVSVERWLPRPDAPDCAYAILKLSAGWIGIYLGTILFDEGESESWSTCWPVRLQLLIGSLTDPLAGPSHDAGALAMSLAGLPVPAAIDTGWHEGMLLHLLLHDLDPAERATHEVLLNLGYAPTVAAVAELANRIANRERLDQAQQAMRDVLRRIEPDAALPVSPQDAEVLLGTAYDRWPSTAEDVVRALLEDPDSDLGRSLEIRRQRAERAHERRGRA